MPLVSKEPPAMTTYRPTIPTTKAAALLDIAWTTLSRHLESGVYDAYVCREGKCAKLYFDTFPAFAKRFAANKGRRTKS